MSKTRSLLCCLLWLGLAGTSILRATAAITLNPAAVPPLAYVKGQPGGGAGASQSVGFVGTANQFQIAPASVPVWLTVSPLNGLAAATLAGTTVTFTANALCVSLASGLYKGSVTVKDLLSGTLLPIPVSVVISDPAPVVNIREGTGSLTARTLALGASPAFTLTLVSPGAPVSFSIAMPSDQTYTQSVGTSQVAHPTGWMGISPPSGVAYSWGTPVTVSIDTSSWAQCAIGGIFAATIVIKYGTPPQGTPQQTLTVPFAVTVSPPLPAITGFTPALLPQVPSGGSATFMIDGNNFVVGLSTVALATVATFPVTLSSSASPDFSYVVLSPSAILITVLGDGANIVAGALSTAAGLTGLTATVTNPDTAPRVSNSLAVTITTAPIVGAITSASSFVQPASGGHPAIAPYDVISIFGTNLCLACTGAVVAPVTPTSPVTALRYPFSLTPDSTNYVQVYFVKHADNTAVAGQGYLLFASNTQINVLVPAGVVGSGVTPLLGTTTNGLGLVDVLVNYGTTAPGAAPAATIVPSGAGSSAPYNVVVAAVNPGIFTVDSTGVGQGAILNFDNSLNGAASGNGSPSAKGGVVQIFMTGLGVPDSTATDATTATARAYPTACLAAVAPTTVGSATVAPGSYLAAVNTALTGATYTLPTGYVPPVTPWTTLDGALVQSAFIPDLAHHFAPCLKTAPTVTIGGKPAVVAYAGWTTDSVVGLYQINVTVPLSASTGDNLVVVTIGLVTSQAGVTVNVL